MSISSLLVKGLKKGHWVWNDDDNELQFVSLIQEKKQRKQREIKGPTAINGLTYVALKVDLKFKTTVNELQLMEFKHFLKERNQGRLDSIVTIQDCKIVAIFLCIQPLPRLFHKFYNLTTVNQLLRACILYIQFYLQTCETVVKTQHYLRGNPVAPGRTSTYQAMKEDLDDLRVLIGRFYAGIIFGGRTMGYSEISKTDEILLFECFLKVSTVVVWIALERKYLSVIKVELERIFRSGYFNNCSAKDTDNSFRSIKKETHVILQGKIADINPKMTRAPNRLASNSPIIHNFMRMDEPKLLMIGRGEFEALRDDRLKFLTKYIFVPETEIQVEGVSLGILGLHRRLFDPLLFPCSKRTLKLLITGSPMDIAEDRKRLRDFALKKAQRESEPQTPHLFDDLPKIPRPHQFTEEVPEGISEVKEEEEESENVQEEEEDEDEEDEEDDLSDGDP